MGASLRKIELPKSRLKLGVRVRICSPLREQIGLLSALRPHERVLVLLQLLGRGTTGRAWAERDRGG